MLDTLTDKLTGVFRNLSGRGRISEENVREAMREVRTALLEADVNFKVVKDFTDRVLEKAIGQEVIKTLKPGEVMVKIVYDELVNLMGPVDTRIYFVQPGPTIIMMCGLQGSGKTTTCGKLAQYLHCDNSNVTGIVDRLEAAGLAERRSAAHDRRVKAVALTGKGEAVRAEVERRAGRPPEALAALSDDDATALRDILRRGLDAAGASS